MKQANLELMVTKDLPEDFLPTWICVMYEHWSVEGWQPNPEFDEDNFGGFGLGSTSSRYIKSYTSGQRIVLATFDEKSLHSHIQKWGKKISEKPSYHGGGMKDVTTSWLEYEKIMFQQLNGVRLFADVDVPMPPVYKQFME